MGTLSYMKIGRKEFHLEVEDTFFTNGTCFIYQPRGEKNRNTCGQCSDNYRHTTTIEISKKYKEVILAGQCDNLILVLEKGSPSTNDHYCTWKVTRVDEVKIEKTSLCELYYIGIGLNYPFPDNGRELFNIKVAKIKERTVKQITLEKDLNYRSKYNTAEYLDKIMNSRSWGTNRLSYGDDFGVFVEVNESSDEKKFEKIESFKDELYKALKLKLDLELTSAQNNLEILNQLAINAGY
jgi:recombinational DNA repair protein RecR